MNQLLKLSFQFCLFVLTTSFALPSLSAQVIDSPRYFPLEPGTVWKYSNDRFTQSMVERKVVGIDEDGFVIFDNGHFAVRFEDELDVIRIEIPDEGFQLYYDFQDFEWTRRSVDHCADGATAIINSRNETVETPAGTFTECIKVEYLGSQCADAGLIAEWFAPEVGLVKWQELNFVGVVTWELEEIEQVSDDPKFKRGDSNSDRLVDISDSITILTHLFLGAPELECEKTADINDDGKIDISDPIFLLSHQLLGEQAPPEPFNTCGNDPTLDTLSCDFFLGCEEGFSPF